MSTLFRRQAIEQQHNRLQGEVLIAQPVTVTFLLLFLFVMIFLALTFLVLGEFTRKEIVRGYLKPDKGIVKIYAAHVGTVDSLAVTEGDWVEMGQPLVRLISQQSLSSGINIHQQRWQALQRKTALLLAKKSLLDTTLVENIKNLRTKNLPLRANLNGFKKQTSLALQREHLLSVRLKTIQPFYEKGGISAREYEALQRQLLTVQQEVVSLNRQIADSQARVNDNRYSEVQLKAALLQQQNQLDQNLAQLQQESTALEGAYRTVIRATVAGRVSTIQVHEGQFAQRGQPLLTLIPRDSELIAVVLVPTRAAGLIEAGQNARIRLDAFPYQRFGSLKGELISVATSLTLPNEHRLPIALKEPAYSVGVRLSSQRAEGYGKTFSLQAGMLLEADIVIETQSLLQWLFDPIYALRGVL